MFLALCTHDHVCFSGVFLFIHLLDGLPWAGICFSCVYMYMYLIYSIYLFVYISMSWATQLNLAPWLPTSTDDGCSAHNLVLFCPTGNATSKELARLRFHCIEKFSDSLPMKSDQAVAFLFWRIEQHRNPHASASSSATEERINERCPVMFT